jgi:hypothetical protein
VVAPIYETGTELFDDVLGTAIMDPDNGMSVSATLETAGQPPRDILVVFRAPFIAISNLGQDVNDVQPQALGLNSDLQDTRRGDVLTVNGHRWRVITPEPAGAAMTRLRLQGPIGDG